MMLSIIVPVYNVKPYIQKCLSELYYQELTDCEIIVVDDGSSDGSSEIVDNFCRGIGSFSVYHKENGGLMSAWMYGVSKAKGDYIGFVDSDDYPCRSMFSEMYLKAKEYNADIVYCDYYVMSPSGKIKRIEKTDDSIIKPGFYFEQKMENVWAHTFPSLSENCISNARWNKIFRREVLLENTKYCQCMSRTFEDRYIVPACMFTAKSFFYLNKPLYYYLDRDGSNCGKPSKTLFEDITRLSLTQKKALEEKNIFNQYQINWEYSTLDMAKQFVKRNITGYGSLSLAVCSSKQLVYSKNFSSMIKKHAAVLKQNGKLGMVMTLAVVLKMPIILIMCRTITKRKYK